MVKLNNADLGEMLLVTTAAKESGFKRVQADPEHIIALLMEVLESRRLRSEGML